MTGRVIPAAGLVILTTVMSVGIAIQRSGSKTDPDTTVDTGLPAVMPLGPRGEASSLGFARTDDTSRIPSNQGATARSLEDDIRELKEAVTALSRVVAALERDRMELAANDKGSIAYPIDAVPDAEPPPDPLTRQFEAEPTDPAWAARAEPLISNAFAAGEITKSQLVYSSCRATVCRIEVSHDDTSAAEDFMFQLLPVISDDFSAVATRFIEDAYGMRSVVLLGNMD